MYVTHPLRFTSDATPADLLAASMTAEPISYTHMRHFCQKLQENFDQPMYKIEFHREQFVMTK